MKPGHQIHVNINLEQVEHEWKAQGAVHEYTRNGGIRNSEPVNITAMAIVHCLDAIDKAVREVIRKANAPTESE